MEPVELEHTAWEVAILCHLTSSLRASQHQYAEARITISHPSTESFLIRNTSEMHQRRIGLVQELQSSTTRMFF
jgi:hypothetical protein